MPGMKDKGSCILTDDWNWANTFQCLVPADVTNEAADNTQLMSDIAGPVPSYNTF